MFLNQSPMWYLFHVAALWLSAATRWLLEDPETSATISLLTSLARSNGFAVVVVVRTLRPRAKALILTMTRGSNALGAGGNVYGKVFRVFKVRTVAG